MYHFYSNLTDLLSLYNLLFNMFVSTCSRFVVVGQWLNSNLRLVCTVFSLFCKEMIHWLSTFHFQWCSLSRFLTLFTHMVAGSVGITFWSVTQYIYFFLRLQRWWKVEKPIQWEATVWHFLKHFYWSELLQNKSERIIIWVASGVTPQILSSFVCWCKG